MLIIGLILLLMGVLLILHSGTLSGKALSPDEFFDGGGLFFVLKHIFTHNPFIGGKKNPLVLVYGILGIMSLLGGIAIFGYFALLFYVDFSR